MNNTVTPSEIAEFVSGISAEGMAKNENTLLGRRVLAAALREPDVQEKLLFLRDVEVEWASQMTAPEEITPDAAAHLAALQESLRRVTQTVAGFSGAENESADSRPLADAAVQEAALLRESGGGRWITEAAQSVRDALETVLQKVRVVQPLVLGRPHALRLPCFAPALAASAPAGAGTVRKETITTADGVRIEFQQLPGNTNRLRVFVDTSLLPPPNAAAADSVSAVYNVAFLTLMEGAENTPDMNRHVLVVALNERGIGFADFAVSSGGGDNAQSSRNKNALPAPRTGGCNLVSATLSYLPRMATAE